MAYKIRVTERNSAAVQEHAFSLGWEWSGINERVMYTQNPFLYLTRDHKLKTGRSEMIFNSDPAKEISASQFINDYIKDL